MNESVYVAKSRQQYDITLNNFLLHVPNHALKGLNTLYYSTMAYAVLIDFITVKEKINIFCKLLFFKLYKNENAQKYKKNLRIKLFEAARFKHKNLQ